MAYNWNAIEQQNLARLNQAQQPGLGQQFAQSAASKLAADQVAKLGLQAAGTAAAGPLGGAAASAASELAGPLASQLVGSLFNKGGAVYKQGGGTTYGVGSAWQPDFGKTITAEQLPEFFNYIYGGTDPGYLQDSLGEGDLYEIDSPKKEAPKKKAAAPLEKKVKEKMKEKVMPEVIAPRAKSRATWNIPLGELLGAEWSTQGHYADMDQGKDPWGAMLKGTWKFDKGGEVPGWWSKAKSAVSKAASHAWKNDNLSKGEGRWNKSKPQYKAIGGLTSGPLGMSDLQIAGKDKAISKVKMKKSKGDMSEEVEYNYHPPLAAKPKPTGE